MSNYRKLVAGAVGLGLMILSREFGQDFTDLEPALIDGILAVLTLVGIERVANTPSE